MMEFVAYPDQEGWVAFPQGDPLVAEGRPDPTRFWLQLALDACTEMWVIWQEDAADYTNASIEYRESGSGSWLPATGTTADHPFTGEGFTPDLRKITKVHLTGLSAETTYEFRFSSEGEVYTFRTFPSSLTGGKSVTLAVAGDSGQSGTNIAAEIAAADADALVHGGDYAYADGLASNIGLWDDFWDAKLSVLIATGNRVIPFIPAIGNHEVIGSWSDDKADAPYFYAYFVIPDESAGAYYEVTAGNYLSLMVLDSEHTSGQMGPSNPQIQWVENLLTENAEVSHRIPIVHVPWWPYRRDPGSSVETRHRVQLGTRLEAAGIRHVFVHHDHCYALTKRILTNQSDPADWENATEDEAGIVYLGNGSWEKGGTPGERWFNASSSNTRHFWRVTLEESRIVATSITNTGAELDTYEDAVATPPGASGTASGAGNSNGSLLRRVLLQAQADGVSEAIAGIRALRSLQALASGSGRTQAAIVAGGLLGARADGTGAVSASLLARRLMSSAAAGSGAASAALSVNVSTPLSGTLSGTSMASASLRIIRRLEVAAAGYGGAFAAISTERRLGGTGSGTGAVEANLGAAIALGGIVSGKSRASAEAQRALRLVATATGAGDASAVVVMSRLLVAAAKGASDAEAGLIRDLPPEIKGPLRSRIHDPKRKVTR